MYRHGNNCTEVHVPAGPVVRSVCGSMRVSVCENVHFCFGFECVCVLSSVPNCSLSAGGKYSSHSSSSTSHLATSHAALAFSPSFPPCSQFFSKLSPLTSRSRNKALQEVQHPKKKREYLTFHHLSLSLFFAPLLPLTVILFLCQCVFRCDPPLTPALNAIVFSSSIVAHSSACQFGLCC